MAQKVALITGITGQDGSYLAALLLSKSYLVHGLVRRSSSLSTARVDPLYNDPDLRLHYGDVCDGQALSRLVARVRPDELYNLAAMSHVAVSFEVPSWPRSDPRSPYACAKLYAHWTVATYRDSYGMHETCLRLNNLDAARDWGHARDYADGMWRMLRRDEPGDYVLATGEMHTVRELVERAFAFVGVEIGWVGERGSRGEVGVDAKIPGVVLVKIDPAYFRPSEVGTLLGDASKAREELGWEPTTTFEALVEEMMRSDMELVAKGDLLS